MNEITTDTSLKEKKKKQEWRYSMEEDNITKTFAVREIENGYLIKKNTYGTDPETDEYFDNDTEFYSEKNPLEDNNKDEALSEAESASNVKNMAATIKDLF